METRIIELFVCFVLVLLLLFCFVFLLFFATSAGIAKRACAREKSG